MIEEKTLAFTIQTQYKVRKREILTLKPPKFFHNKYFYLSIYLCLKLKLTDKTIQFYIIIVIGKGLN